jgi:C-terminal processing protease CtpA/Prc
MKSIFLRNKLFFLSAFVLLTVWAGSFSIAAQSFDRIERDRMKAMLKNVKTEVKKSYYDPNFHGIDIEARFKKAEERLDQVTSTGQALGVIGQVLIDFNDSHLFFLPPPTNLQVQYGWRYKMVGDKCIITSVKPGSDADKKGVKVGDQIMGIQGFRPSRNELWKVQYYYNLISPRDRIKLTLLSPGTEAPRDLEVQSEIKKQATKITFTTYFKLGDGFHNEENDKHRFLNLGNISAWKFPSFEFDPAEVSSLMSRFDKSEGLIIDLRGNGGGYVKTMERLTGHVFDKDIKVAELKGRKPMDPSIAKTAGGKDVYKGKIIVLLDSQSGSASEVFARVLQLEKRGQVLGDVSAGAVMQSIPFNGELGTDSVVFYGASITNADLIMADGKSLEHIGVIPDELILPTPEDVAAGRDPVLARAFEILGKKVSPEDAGKAFPGYFWR